MPLQEAYQVSIDAFCGPLDLLLFLIRRAEVDVHDVPIAAITDQYVAFLGELDDIDIDLAGEFLVMAATLIEIKSRTLAPVKPTGDSGDHEPAGGDDGDPRYELIRQLIAYQRFRTASEALLARRDAFARRFPSRPARRDRDRDQPDAVELELEDAHALDLADAYERIMSSIDLSRIGDHTVEMDDTPLALHAEDLLDRLGRTPQGRLTLQQTFEGCNRSQRVGLFLATLELVRQRRVLVRQDGLNEAIEVELREPEPDEVPMPPDEAGSAPSPAAAATDPDEDHRS